MKGERGETTIERRFAAAERLREVLFEEGVESAQVADTAGCHEANGAAAKIHYFNTTKAERPE